MGRDSEGGGKAVTDAEGNRTTYEYDGHDRLVKTRFPSPTTDNSSSTTDYEQLTLDAGGNVTSRRLRDGNSIAMTYDALNRLTERDLPGSELTVTYTYDLLNRPTGASQTGNALAFTYDALGRNLSQAGPRGTVSSTYDLAGRRTRMTYADTGLYVDYDYLVTGEATKIRENGATSGVGVLGTYAYDDLGRRTSLTRGNGAVTSYTYDNVSRLTRIVQNPSGTSYDLTLDFSPNPAGQIASTTRSNDSYAWTNHYAINRNYTANGLNQYTAAGGITPTYDSRGNLTSAGAITYSYNSGNMLTAASGGVTLSYDPMQRLYETVGGGVTTRMAYDGASLIAEYNGSNTLLRRYVHGPGVDEPLVWYEGSGTSDRRWLHADERGSVVAVSNGSGAVTNINAYDEYGIPRPTNVGRFQYTGQQWIAELGMYHYRARIYSPTLGRFLQTDPIGFGGGMNIYAYVLNDPVNFTDSTGLACDGSDGWDGVIVCARPILINASGGGGGGTNANVSLNTRINEDEALTCRLDPLCATVTGARQRATRTMSVSPPLLLQLASSITRGRSDHCGSATQAWPPDRVFGTDISGPCAMHDVCYGSSTDRLVCDEQLMQDIWMECGRQSRKMGCYAAGPIYFLVVRRRGRSLYTGAGNPD